MVLSTTVDDDNLHMRFGPSKRPDVLNTEATSYAHGWVVMSLATGFLTLAQIQLLADCIEPVLVLNIPPYAETLIHRGLLVSSDSNCDQRSCHILAVTERGRSYVIAWVGRQERSPRRTGRIAGGGIGFAVMGAVGVHTFLL